MIKYQNEKTVKLLKHMSTNKGCTDLMYWTSKQSLISTHCPFKIKPPKEDFRSCMFFSFAKVLFIRTRKCPDQRVLNKYGRSKGDLHLNLNSFD